MGDDTEKNTVVHWSLSKEFYVLDLYYPHFKVEYKKVVQYQSSVEILKFNSSTTLLISLFLSPSPYG